MDSSVQKLSSGAQRKQKGSRMMERSRNSLGRLAVLALLAMAAAAGCAAETSPDPSPGNEANLNPQPLPPGEPTGGEKTAGDDDDVSTGTPSGESSSGGASSSSGGTSGTSGQSSGSSGTNPHPPDAGKE